MSSLGAFSWLQSSLGIDITGEWNSLVNFNVGGCAFSCQRRTFKCLADSSVLCQMALAQDGRTVAKTEDGSIIIDRDPETFRHVLNFLRGNAQKLLLPDDFADWDLLLEDARVYGLPGLVEAVKAHPRYQQRCFLQSLPHGVMLRWTEGAPRPAETAAATAPRSSDRHVELFPPLHLLEVVAAGTASSSAAAAAAPSTAPSAAPSTSTTLTFQGREVSSVDEAVTIILFTYQMHIETWHRDTIANSGGRIAHTIFFTRK